MTGPTIRRRVLGKELRAIRDAAGKSREEVAAILGCSPTKVTYLETGRNVIGKTELEVLTQRLGAADSYEGLEELRQEANRRGWWSTARLPEPLGAYVGLEQVAATARTFEVGLVPGLLQTERYARDLHLLNRTLTTDDVERRVATRMRRQHRLDPDATGRMDLSVVITQSVIDNCLHYPDGGADQLRRLADRAGQPNVELLVVPPGMNAGLFAPFTILSFPGGVLAEMAWQENSAVGHIVEDPGAVARLVTMFGDLRSQALGASESLALIAESLESITHQ